jgi:chromosome segregation ATPase
MKRSNTPSRRRPSRIPLAAAAALAALAPISEGCVTKARYDRDVGGLEKERAQLQARVRDLSRSNEALGDERVKLLDQMEDLRQAKEQLESDVAKLEKTRDLLSGHLKDREEKLQELSKLSGSYEGLVADLEAEVSAG